MNASFPTSFASLGLALAMALPTVAQSPVLFTNGQTADATAVNGNFTLVNNKATSAQAAADAAQAAAASAAAAANQLTAGLTVLGNGNVGVGISPVTKLHVNGDLICAPTAGNTLRLIGSNDNTSLMHYTGNEVVAGMVVDGWTGQARGSLQFLCRGVGNTTPQVRMVITEPGLVGIDVPAPTAKLDINGDIRLNSLLRFGADNQNGDPINISRATGASEESVLAVRVGDDGSGFDRFDIAMGTTGAATFSLVGNGSAFKPGGGSWSSISDARKKKNIQPRTHTLAQLLQLRATTFEYIDPTVTGTGPGVHTGFIAQEVETVFPEWVSELEDGTKFLSISGFEALTVEALRELDTTNKKVAAENEQLRARLTQLESLAAEFAQLKAAVQPLLAK